LGVKPNLQRLQRSAQNRVAVEGDCLVAAGMDPLKAYAAAKEEGIQTPFVVQVLPEDPLPFVPGS